MPANSPLHLLVFLPALALPSCFSGFEQSSRSPTQREAPTATAAATQPAAASRPSDGGVLAEGKKEQQSLADAWTLICDAGRRSGADPSRSRQQRGAAVASWIVDNVKNKRARYWFINLRKIDKARREAEMRREAAKAGVARCALADLLFDDEPTTQPVP